MHNCVRKSLPAGLNAIGTMLTWTKDWYLWHPHPNSPELISGQQFKLCASAFTSSETPVSAKHW